MSTDNPAAYSQVPDSRKHEMNAILCKIWEGISDPDVALEGVINAARMCVEPTQRIRELLAEAAHASIGRALGAFEELEEVLDMSTDFSEYHSKLKGGSQ